MAHLRDWRRLVQQKLRSQRESPMWAIRATRAGRLPAAFDHRVSPWCGLALTWYLLLPSSCPRTPFPSLHSCHHTGSIPLRKLCSTSPPTILTSRLAPSPLAQSLCPWLLLSLPIRPSHQSGTLQKESPVMSLPLLMPHPQHAHRTEP